MFRDHRVPRTPPRRLSSQRDLVDSSVLYQRAHWAELRQNLAQDGYLLLRDVLPSEACLKAYSFLAQELSRCAPATIDNTGGLLEGAGRLGLLSRQDLAQAPHVRSLLESQELHSLMQRLLQGPVVTTEYKWLRAVATGEGTGVHMDKVYLGSGSERLLTAWLALGNIPRVQGSMMISHASHRKRTFARLRQSYGKSVVGKDGTSSGWLGRGVHDLSEHVSPYAADWRTADFKAGDVVVLGLDVLHLTAPNMTRQVRISCDTRWQPAVDKQDPRAGRWVQLAA